MGENENRLFSAVYRTDNQTIYLINHYSGKTIENINN